MMDSVTSVRRRIPLKLSISYGYNPNNPFERPSSSESQTTQPQLLPQMDNLQLSGTAASAIEELKRLFSTDEAHLWVMSSIDHGAYVIDQDSYEKFSHSVKHFRSYSARVESSKYGTVVPIEATRLIDFFLDSEEWKKLFPAIVNKARTIHTLGSELRILEQQLHILSPLVPPREFMIVRCCKQIGDGLWIIADVSHSIVEVSPSCYKRPSGVLIQALPNAQTKVTWIEHVEVDNKPLTHLMYRNLESGGSGYGAKRWIVTLERMCERMALSSMPTMPATDWGEIIQAVEGRKSVMKLGERMLKNFNDSLIMPRNVPRFSHHSECGGVRISTWWNVATAAYCLSVPLTPLEVFNLIRSNEFRHQWDDFCHGNAITEVARVFTGSGETNYINILQHTLPRDAGQNMVEEPQKKMVVLQECYMDALGGMIVFAPLDMDQMSIVASGKVDPLEIPILPSGFAISRDGRGSMDGGTLLTFAFQILLSGENVIDSVVALNALISKTVQRIKILPNCPSE